MSVTIKMSLADLQAHAQPNKAYFSPGLQAGKKSIYTTNQYKQIYSGHLDLSLQTVADTHEYKTKYLTFDPLHQKSGAVYSKNSMMMHFVLHFTFDVYEG